VVRNGTARARSGDHGGRGASTSTVGSAMYRRILHYGPTLEEAARRPGWRGLRQLVTDP